MTPERWQQVKALFQSAVEGEASQRAAFLDQACAGEPSLRRQVEALLASHEQAPSFLASATFEVAVLPLEADLMVGQRIGPYEVVGEIGRGGMGEVYLAQDKRLGRQVALKFLPAFFQDDPDRRARLLTEARAASSLHSPHIAAIHDIGEHEGRAFIVMEYVKGELLSQKLKHGPLALSEAIDIGIQIADALEEAHAQGIIHRDIKGSNLMITPRGQVKVLDFGLAKVAQRPADGKEVEQSGPTQLEETAPGIVMGTVHYMSPEQARGLKVDTRTDLFSLGVVLYEMVAGHVPFDGQTSSDVLAAILEREPEQLARHRPEVPAELERIVRQCLEKDREVRYQTASDLRADLKRLKRGMDSGHLDAAVATPAAHRAPRRRWWLGIAAVATLLLLAGVAGWLARRRASSAENPLANAQFTRFTDFPGSEGEAAISPDGKFVAFLSDREGPFDVWLSRVGSGRFTNLTQGKEDTSGAPRNVGFSGDGSEIWLSGAKPSRRLRLMPLMGGTARVFLREHVVNVAWSPDSERLVYHTNDPGDPMFVADRSGSSAKQIFVNPMGEGGHTHFPAWSQDDRWIYFVTGIGATAEYDLWRIAPSGGEPERLTHHNNDVVYPTPIDSRTVMYVSPAEDRSGPWLWALDVERKTTRRVSFGLEKYTSVAASADGRRLVATVSNPTASLWSVPILDRLAEERDVKPFPLPTVRALAPRFGAAALFYLSSRGADDGLWRYQDGQALEIWKGADGALREPPAVSPDGRRVAMVLRQQEKQRLHVLSADGAELEPLAKTIEARGTACWSGDGKWIVTGGDDASGPGLFQIPVEGGAPVRLIVGKALNPVWSPDGTLIVYAGPQVAQYVPLLAVRPDGTPVELPAIQLGLGGERYRFLPNGKSLVYMQATRNPSMSLGNRQLASQDFRLLDLTTKKTRPLTRLNNVAPMRTFDITPDGKQIVFDRLRENSDIVLIDLPK